MPGVVSLYRILVEVKCAITGSIVGDLGIAVELVVLLATTYQERPSARECEGKIQSPFHFATSCCVSPTLPCPCSRRVFRSMANSTRIKENSPIKPRIETAPPAM